MNTTLFAELPNGISIKWKEFISVGRNVEMIKRDSRWFLYCCFKGGNPICIRWILFERLIVDSIPFEKVISYRNLLQSCNYPEFTSNFSPYLFDLSTVGTDRCLDDNFVYPDVC